jgi:hypothetical protein
MSGPARPEPGLGTFGPGVAGKREVAGRHARSGGLRRVMVVSGACYGDETSALLALTAW